ncbi:DUF4129 domain-containing protein [Actinokineospora bangkokensis]|nr:DUF4129 domain-containing protein [Actinokineospora bangkokensis]
MRSRAGVLLGVAAMVLVIVVAARGGSAIEGGPGVRYAPATATATAGPEVAEAPPDDGVLGLVAGVGTGVLVLLLLAGVLLTLAAALVALAGIRVRGRGPSRPEHAAADTAEESARAAAGVLAATVERARLDLSRRAGTDPGDAVIAAWVALERAAHDLGTPRAPHRTPTEFTEDVLGAHHVDAGALDDLKALYHRARFATAAPLDPADAERAGGALRRIEASLR